MDRRKFIKDSTAGAMAALARRAAISSLAQVSGEAAPAAVSAKFIEIPDASYQVTDPVSTVPITVTLDRFLISSMEVTQRGFEEVMGYNPSFHKGPDLPAETVTWWEAIGYCNQRSLKENLQPCYDLESGACDLRKNGYRLPTEAEWTHAAALDSSRHFDKNQANLGSSDTTHAELLIRELETSGTRPVGSYAPNAHGLYDMIGNVWEWCNDYFDPAPTPQASNPRGPARGLARVIRGGSFISTTSSWAREYRSGMEPEYKSRFTGFRVCRSILPGVEVRHSDPTWSAPYNQAPSGHENTIGLVSPLVSGGMTLTDWNRRRNTIEAKWANLLGSIEMTPPSPKTQVVETIRGQNYTAKLMNLQVEPDWWEKILVMAPSEPLSGPRPTVIVPFYDVDDPAGLDLEGRSFRGGGTRAFAHVAVQMGYIAVAIRWFGESYGESTNEAIANLKLRHPRCTGLGKWIWDTHRLLDYLETLPEVDSKRIGMIGHSLGGKMALYSAAFDKRIAAVVSSELGVGLSFSNYQDYWYFGDFIQRVDKSTDQHELIGLIAPRPFLLIGGDQYDTAQSWYYINSARQVYELYGKRLNIGYFNHHTGHSPTPEAVWRSMEWLKHFLGRAT